MPLGNPPAVCPSWGEDYPFRRPAFQWPIQDSRTCEGMPAGWRTQACMSSVATPRCSARAPMADESVCGTASMGNSFGLSNCVYSLLAALFMAFGRQHALAPLGPSVINPTTLFGVMTELAIAYRAGASGSLKLVCGRDRADRHLPFRVFRHAALAAPEMLLRLTQSLRQLGGPLAYVIVADDEESHCHDDEKNKSHDVLRGYLLPLREVRRSTLPSAARAPLRTPRDSIRQSPRS
jgi:hypothetical protein